MALIQLKGVSKIYTSGEHVLRALDNVDMNIEKGKFVVILGPSGAGKSTLLNILGGLDASSEGSVIVLYNLDSMGYTERYLEMATLKVVGFNNKKIAALLIGQTMLMTVVGVVLGFPLGVLVLKWLTAALASEYEMAVCLGPMTYLVSILVTAGVSFVVSLLVARKNKKIDMVAALKAPE